MLELFQLADACGGLGPIVSVVKNGLFPLIYMLIPIVLIILVVIDFGKAVISSDEKEVKAAQSRAVKRAIYTALIYFIVVLVTVVMNLVSAGETGNTDGWEACWNAAK